MEEQLISFETAKLAKEKGFNEESDIGYKENGESMTIDRLDCTKGYTKENVVLACYAANCGRGDCSVESWKLIINNIKNGLNTKS